jgi:hypothetical protein
VAVWVLQEILWTIEFSNFTIAHDHDFVTLDDGLETMSNSEHCAVLEFFVYQFLDHLLSFNVDIGSCFIKENDFVLTENSSADLNERLLT